jgi:hypothetical protein
MPEALERELKSQGRKKGLKGRNLDAYVYGTLRKTGWKPSGEGIHLASGEDISNLGPNTPVNEEQEARPVDNVGRGYLPVYTSEGVPSEYIDFQELGLEGAMRKRGYVSPIRWGY